MPWKSKAQERWGNSPAGHKALGDQAVSEFNQASKGAKIPERKKSMAKKKEKEIGIPKNAPKAAKKADEAYDKAHKVKEGSKADLKADKKIMAKYDKKKYVRD